MSKKPATQSVLAVLMVAGFFFTPLARAAEITDSALESRYVYESSQANVKWAEGHIEIRAGATADPSRSVNLSHARSIALKTARHLAYERLLEAIKGISLTSHVLYRDELLENSTLRTKLEGFVRGTRVVKEEEKFLPDGSIWVEVTLGRPIYGQKSLTATSLERRPGPRPEPVAPRKDAASRPSRNPRYSGLVVDARNLGVRPAMFPKILRSDGRAVYSPDQTDDEYIVTHGLVGYAVSTERARQLQRVGVNPLIVKARRASGPHRADVVVNDEDAVKILAADVRSKILNEARVVFVIN